MMESGTQLVVAVFPLQDAVLFPGVTLPLHLPEDKHRKILTEIQGAGLPLAISLAVQQSETEFLLNTVCGAGEVQIFPSEILIHGKLRVKLLDVLQEEPYFIMKAESLENATRVQSMERTSFEHFKTLVKTWAFINPRLPHYLPTVFDAFQSFGPLTDFFVFHFIESPKDKQVYLNCLSPEERAEMLTRYLETDLVRLSRKLKREQKFSLLH